MCLLGLEGLGCGCFGSMYLLKFLRESYVAETQGNEKQKVGKAFARLVLLLFHFHSAWTMQWRHPHS